MRRGWLGRLRVHEKLCLVGLVPVLTLLAFAGVSVKSSVDEWHQAGRTEHKINLLAALIKVSYDLTSEGGVAAVEARVATVADEQPGIVEQFSRGFPAALDSSLAELGTATQAVDHDTVGRCSPDGAVVLELGDRVATARAMADAGSRSVEFGRIRAETLATADCLGQEARLPWASSLLALVRSKQAVAEELVLLFSVLRPGVLVTTDLQADVAHVAGQQHGLLATAAAIDPLVAAWAPFPEESDLGTVPGYEGLVKLETQVLDATSGDVVANPGALTDILLATAELDARYEEVSTAQIDRMEAQVRADRLAAGRSTIGSVLVASMAVLVTGGVTLWVARSLVAPLGTLASHARLVTSGHLPSAPMDLDGRDELSDLGRAFDSMVDGLKAVEAQLIRFAEGDTAGVDDIETLDGSLGESVHRSLARLEDVNGRLRSSERVSLAAIESAPDAMLITDDAGRIQSINSAAVQLLSAAEHDLVGSMLQDHVPEAFTGWDGRSGIHKVELLLTRPHGDQIPVVVSWTTSVRNHVGLRTAVIRDVTDQKVIEGRLAHEANHCSLTGLLNRSGLTAALDKWLTDDHDPMLTVLFIDLDRFKQVNDAHGHTAGDALLVETAARLRRQVRSDDLVARNGGDEFLIVAAGIDLEMAQNLAERLVSALALPFHLDELGVGPLFVSGSVGIAMSDSASSAEDLVTCADIAMYQAKRHPGTDIVTYDEELRAEIESSVQLEAEFRTALEVGEVESHFQPLVDLVTGHVKGFEALARWNRHDGSSVSPAEFIPMAEQTGLIEDVWLVTLANACEALSVWRRSSPQITASLNLSGRQLVHSGVVGQVRQALASHGLPGECLVLELTETSLIGDEPNAIGIIRELSELGVTVHLDDFGTGFSSIEHLRQFPVTAIKIDRTFTDELDVGESAGPASQIVQSMLSLAGGLGLAVIAEGVSSEQIRRNLISMGCRIGQGFLFSAAVNAAEAGDLLGHSLLERADR